MSAVEILEQIRRMPPAEQSEMLEKIWQEFGDFDDSLTPEEIAELDRRAEDALKNPGRGTPIEWISADIRKRLLGKQ
jgi:putative addiction module component (TIGR02574 family)